MIKVLALDLAKNRTGWAVGSSDMAPPRWGVFETVDWVDHEGENIASFERLLASFEGLSHIVFEHVFVDNRNGGRNFNFNGTDAQISLKAIAIRFAHFAGIPVLRADINHWRMRFLGLSVRPKEFKGDENYWKRLAVKAAAQRDWYVEHHDSAEALGIMDYSLANLDKTYKLKTNPIFGRQQADVMFGRGAHA